MHKSIKLNCISKPNRLNIKFILNLVVCVIFFYKHLNITIILKYIYKFIVAGGRSRLHLLDLGSCERSKSSGGLTLSGLGNVLLAIFNGQKHLPHRFVVIRKSSGFTRSILLYLKS